VPGWYGAGTDEPIAQGSNVRCAYKKGGGFMSETQAIPDTTVQYDKIGGWLILVGIGLVISPFIRLYGVYNDFLPAFSPEIWTVLTTPGSSVYHPLWAPAMIYELVGNILLGLAPIILLIYFLRKHKLFPKLYIILLVSQLGFLMGDYIFATSIPVIVQEGTTYLMREVIQSLVSSLIWIRYFLVTERAKGTFVN
jgi:hypothetical protein